MRLLPSVLGLCALWAGSLIESTEAAPVIDGTADLEYGARLSEQNTNTQFGDALRGDAIYGAGSEIDQVFGTIAGDRLYVTITGNLEHNFNKLEVFIDSVAGGVNTIDGSSLPAGVDAFCCGGFGTSDGALQRMNGLKFDAGFDADYFLSFMHGFETLNPFQPGELRFWAMTAHYAELNEGTAGDVVPVGMQLAQRGLPRALRGSNADFDTDGDVDGIDFLAWQQFAFTVAATSRAQGDTNGDNLTDQADLDRWESEYGFDVAAATFGDFPYAPQNAFDDSEALLGPTLTGLGLGQGELIDKDFAFGSGNCADANGTDCLLRELEFVLPLADGDLGNALSHRNMENSIGLEMAIDNSNAAGVTGGDPFNQTEGDPGSVRTGVEFSIPLAAIGNPTGSIRLTALINGNFHDFASNQFSGDGVQQGNFGGLMPDLEFEAVGNQFVVISPPLLDLVALQVPEPGCTAIVSVAVWAALTCRRSFRRRGIG